MSSFLYLETGYPWLAPLDDYDVTTVQLLILTKTENKATYIASYEIDLVSSSIQRTLSKRQKMTSIFSSFLVQANGSSPLKTSTYIMSYSCSNVQLDFIKYTFTMTHQSPQRHDLLSVHVYRFSN